MGIDTTGLTPIDRHIENHEDFEDLILLLRRVNGPMVRWEVEDGYFSLIWGRQTIFKTCENVFTFRLDDGPIGGLSLVIEYARDSNLSIMTITRNSVEYKVMYGVDIQQNNYG